MPAPIFKAFMAEAHGERSVEPFPDSAGHSPCVRIDTESGAVASPGERGTIIEAFKPGTEPTSASANGLLPVVGGQRNEPAPGRDDQATPRNLLNLY